MDSGARLCRLTSQNGGDDSVLMRRWGQPDWHQPMRQIGIDRCAISTFRIVQRALGIEGGLEVALDLGVGCHLDYVSNV